MLKPTLMGSAARAGAVASMKIARAGHSQLRIASSEWRIESIISLAPLESCRSPFAIRPPLFHHLLRRPGPPQVCRGRVLRPHLRPLRIVAMPRPGIEIAERLVLHLVEFGKQLGDQSVRAAMIGEQVVADAVPPRSPQRLVAVEAEEIAGVLQMRPVAQLEGRVEVAVRSRLDQVDRVVIRAAAQEREEVSHPVGDAEAEDAAVEIRDA